MNDKLGDVIKAYEKDSEQYLDEKMPICVRLDGKAFHTFCKGLARPFDKRLSDVMINTMNYLVERTDAKIGYTQSDEITLIYYTTATHQQTLFGGRVQKLSSVLASMTTAKFNRELSKAITEKADALAFFDCRVFNVPDLEGVENVLKWRWLDAKKNSISMAAHTVFGHKAIMHKNSEQKIQMLRSTGNSWEDLPEFFKYGTFSYKNEVVSKIPEDLLKFHKGVSHFKRSVVLNQCVDDIDGIFLKNTIETPFTLSKSKVSARNQNVGKETK